ncbi:MAG: PEP-CTERM sorting domain-containing protein [Verrucomicrobiales bacterium]
MASVAAQAAIVYDNTSNLLGSSTDYKNAEVGDQITLAAGPDRVITDFYVDYFLGPAAVGGTTPNGNETFQLFIRLLDGPGGVPGTTLYSSGVQPLTPGYQIISAEGLSLDLAATPSVFNTLSFSVDFDGIEGTEQAGLLFYGGPTVGTSSDFFWKREDGGTFGAFNTPDITDNFGARVVAVPEPGTWALILGGLATLGVMNFRRKS